MTLDESRKGKGICTLVASSFVTTNYIGQTTEESRGLFCDLDHQVKNLPRLPSLLQLAGRLNVVKVGTATLIKWAHPWSPLTHAKAGLQDEGAEARFRLSAGCEREPPWKYRLVRIPAVKTTASLQMGEQLHQSAAFCQLMIFIVLDSLSLST